MIRKEVIKMVNRRLILLIVVVIAIATVIWLLAGGPIANGYYLIPPSGFVTSGIPMI